MGMKLYNCFHKKQTMKYFYTLLLVPLLAWGDLNLDNTFKGELDVKDGSVKVYDVAETSKGNFALCGENKEEAFVYMMNPKGDSIWSRNFSFLREALAMDATPDGGLIISGIIFLENKSVVSKKQIATICLVKLSENGDPMWVKKVDSQFRSQPDDLKVFPNGDILLFGEYNFEKKPSEPIAFQSLRFMRFDQDGNNTWNKRVPESVIVNKYGSSTKYFFAEQLDIKDEELAFFMSNSLHEFRVGSINLKAKEIYKMRRYSNDNSPKFTDGYSIQSLGDDLVFSASNVRDSTTHSIVKADFNFDVLWKVSITCDESEQSKLLVTKSQEIFFVGTTLQGDMLVAKFSEDGEKIWEKEYKDVTGFEISQLTETSGGRILIAGNANSNYKDGSIYGRKYRTVFYCIDTEGNIKN